MLLLVSLISQSMRRTDTDLNDVDCQKLMNQDNFLETLLLATSIGT